MNTREEWLLSAITAVRPVFEALGHPLPLKIKASSGFPSSKARSLNKAIGEHWSPTASTSGHHEIFISPVVSDSFDCFGVLIHELVHSVTLGQGHKGDFPRIAKKLWLEGKPTSTTIGQTFKTNFADIVASLGDYPHESVNVGTLHKPQSTRMLKASCEDCGYVIRLTKTWADKGLPTCVCGSQFSI